MKNDGVLYHQVSSFSPGSCDYDLFEKVKEPVRGIRYYTRDELIRAIGQSIWNINKDGHADGVLHLPNIWQNVINKGATILKVRKCCTPVNNHHHQSVLPKGKSISASAGTKEAVLPKAGLPPQTQEPRLQFYYGLNMCGSFPLLSARHSLFSI